MPPYPGRHPGIQDFFGWTHEFFWDVLSGMFWGFQTYCLRRCFGYFRMSNSGLCQTINYRWTSAICLAPLGSMWWLYLPTFTIHLQCKKIYRDPMDHGDFQQTTPDENLLKIHMKHTTWKYGRRISLSNVFFRFHVSWESTATPAMTRFPTEIRITSHLTV